MSSDLARGLAAFQAKLDRHVERGLARAGSLLLRDCIMETNKVPLDEGTLTGSGSVFVGNRHTESAAPVGGTPQPATSFSPPGFSAGQKVVTVGFNTPYAARLHEGVDFEFNEGDQGRGAKFLEMKLVNPEPYYAEINANVQNAFKK
jgi:hypothetical protein